MISNGTLVRDSVGLDVGAAASVTTTTGCSTAGAASVGATIGVAGNAATSPDGAGGLGTCVGFDDSGTVGRLPGSGVVLTSEEGRAAGALVPWVAPVLEAGVATTLPVVENGVTVAPIIGRGVEMAVGGLETTGVFVGVVLGRGVGVTVGVVPGSGVDVSVGVLDGVGVKVAVAAVGADGV